MADEKNKTTDESKAFWSSVQAISSEVWKWPEWKRGGSDAHKREEPSAPGQQKPGSVPAERSDAPVRNRR